MKHFLLALFVSLLSGLAQAQVPIQGIFPLAFNTTFDPNTFGGLSNPNVSFSCITAVVAGKCNVGFNATCNGTGSDATAHAAWVAASIAANPKLAVLYVPPGSNCVLDGTGTNGRLTSDGSVHGTDGIRNPIIWMYQATFSGVLAVGGFTFQNNTTQALINSAKPGDTCVVVNDGNVGRFTVGRWIIITALAIQTFGFPPNFQFFEYRFVTSIIGNSVCFGSPLVNSYSANYPQMDLGGPSSTNLGGPAQIYTLEPSWNTNIQLFGGTLISASFAGLIFAGTTIVTQDVIIPNGIGPTVSPSITFIRSNVGSVEVDKEITTLNFIQSNSDQIDIQSASVDTINISASTLRRGLAGGAKNTNIVNSILTKNPSNNNSIQAGALCCGVSQAVSLNGVSVAVAQPNFHHLPISDFTLNNGVLTISKASGDYSASAGLWVPGHKYFMGDIDGSNSCPPGNTFTVSDVQDAGANVNIVTNIVSIPVALLCNGVRAPSTFGAYQAMSLTQTASGPANLLSNPEMVPP